MVEAGEQPSQAGEQLQWLLRKTYAQVETEAIPERLKRAILPQEPGGLLEAAPFVWHTVVPLLAGGALVCWAVVSGDLGDAFLATDSLAVSGH